LKVELLVNKATDNRRTLKEPEGCKASSFNHTGHPTRLLSGSDLMRGVFRNSPCSRPCKEFSQRVERKERDEINIKSSKLG
jgi:hypothetical protein